MSTTTQASAEQLAADAAAMPNRRIVEVMQSAGYTGPTSYGKRRLVELYSEFFTNCPVTEAADWTRCTCTAEDTGGEHWNGCPLSPATEDEAEATAALERPTEPKAQAKLLGLPLKSFEFFRDLAEDAPNWSGAPLIGGNVGQGRSNGGMTRKLVDAGLITTITEEGDTWAAFTDAGKAAAAKIGIDISWA